MDETEVTNLCRIFRLAKRRFPREEEHIYMKVLRYFGVEENRLGYNETMTNNYLRHPSLCLLSCSRCKKLDSSS
jgi:hypothetical protein